MALVLTTLVVGWLWAPVIKSRVAMLAATHVTVSGSPPRSTLSGGRLRFGRWVPDVAVYRACGSAPTLNHSAQPRELPMTAPRMLRRYNASIDQRAEALAARHRSHDRSHGKATSLCHQRRPSANASAEAPSPSAVDRSAWRCDGIAAAHGLGAAGVRLLVGVHTTPTSPARREAIRLSWKRYPSEATLVCFVVGLGGLSMSTRSALANESTRLGDLTRLPNVADDVCHMSIEKAFGWWAWAATSAVEHVARVDDDTFLHVPRLEAVTAALHCHSHLVFGQLANVGYNPATFSKCGYSWRGQRNWQRYGCAGRGFHQPSLFPSGMLQLLSARVVRALAASREVREFVRRATRLISVRSWDRTEDVALGFWLHMLLADGALPTTTFVRARPHEAHNLGCQKNDGMYRPPDGYAIAVHFIKRPQGMAYVKELLDGRRAHEPRACTRAAGVG